MVLIVQVRRMWRLSILFATLRALLQCDHMRLSVDADITRAETLPGEAYRSRELHARIVERVFAPSWQLGPDAALVTPGTIMPFTLLPGTLDDPLLLARDGESLRCLSNVCT